MDLLGDVFCLVYNFPQFIFIVFLDFVGKFLCLVFMVIDVLPCPKLPSQIPPRDLLIGQS